MDAKKTEKANINKKKVSYLMLGLVCATSLTLMSFELRSFDVSRDLYSNASEDAIEDVFTFAQIEVIKPQPKIVKPLVSNKEFVEVTKDPIVIDVPEPVEDEPVDSHVDWDELKDVDYGDDPDDGSGDVVVIEPVTLMPQKMPVFLGGLDAMYAFLGNEVQYPAISRDHGTEGTAYVRFTVEKDGSISDIVILKGVDKYIDKESKRVVKKMPKWTPGENMGKKVRVYFTLPIRYIMN